jgi:hypothetical protein
MESNKIIILSMLKKHLKYDLFLSMKLIDLNQIMQYIKNKELINLFFEFKQFSLSNETLILLLNNKNCSKKKVIY